MQDFARWQALAVASFRKAHGKKTSRFACMHSSLLYTRQLIRRLDFSCLISPKDHPNFPDPSKFVWIRRPNANAIGRKDRSRRGKSEAQYIYYAVFAQVLRCQCADLLSKCRRPRQSITSCQQLWLVTSWERGLQPFASRQRELWAAHAVRQPAPACASAERQQLWDAYEPPSPTGPWQSQPIPLNKRDCLQGCVPGPDMDQLKCT